MSSGDEPSGLQPRLIRPDTLVALSRLNALLALFHIFGEWALILGAIGLCSRYWNPALYVLVVVWIGARQHALAVLMHDGAHYRLFQTRSLNDIVSDLFLAWPLLISTRSYRRNHFAHHRHVNTDLDPDWVRKQTGDWRFPKRWYSLAGLLLRDVMGLNTHEQFKAFAALSKAVSDTQSNGSGDAYVVLRLSYYGVLAFGLSFLHLWKPFLLYWVIPLFTWLKMILRIRSIAEHFAADDGQPLSLTRTTNVSVFERLFVASKNINYHVEHHRFPSVPFFNLPKLHRLLMDSEEFRAQAHISKSYLAALGECTTGAAR